MINGWNSLTLSKTLELDAGWQYEGSYRAHIYFPKVVDAILAKVAAATRAKYLLETGTMEAWQLRSMEVMSPVFSN